MMKPAEPPQRQRSARKRRRSPVGAAPGTLVADPAARQPILTLTGISGEKSQRFENIAIGDVARLQSEWPVVWLDCAGLGNAETIAAIGKQFGLHQLSLEDVINTGQRPKADFFDDHVVVILDMIDDVISNRHEQISIFFAENFVVTFQERAGDCFEPVRKRMGGDPSKLHKRKADYLAYSLIDAIVDSYFPVLEALEESVERLEADVLGQRSRRQMGRLHDLRRDMLSLKRSLWPMRDAIAALVRTDSPCLAKETRVYLNDALDHATQLIEMVETYRETTGSLIEMYVSLGQARTSEVINVLTIVSTIFIPLTFLAGIWGMNFDPATSPWNMPELVWEYGYPAALGFMLFVAVSLVTYFKWRKWF